MISRIFSLTVTRNEEHRYLAAMLSQLAPVVDGRFVFDDCSTDRTADIALAAGCTVIRREENSPTPSFLEHEGRFRQAAWDEFEFWMEPQPEDWVLAIDSDEFLASHNWDMRDCLQRNIRAAGDRGSIALRIPEVFGVDDDGCPLIRTDGFWDTISARRLFRYQPGGRFRDKAMGCGSEPTYVAAIPSAAPVDLTLLHYGYAAEADQQAKHERYTSLSDNGHDGSHVASIVGRKTLERWDGPWRPVEVTA